MFEMNLTPSYSDADPSRHINGATYPRWFEKARNPICRFFIPDLEPSRWNLILRKIEIDMVAECYFNYEVTIRSFIESIGRTSFVVDQEAWQNGKMVARGKCVIVHFDLGRKTKLEIPEPIRRNLEQHLRPSFPAPVE